MSCINQLVPGFMSKGSAIWLCTMQTPLRSMKRFLASVAEQHQASFNCKRDEGEGDIRAMPPARRCRIRLSGNKARWRLHPLCHRHSEAYCRLAIHVAYELPNVRPDEHLEDRGNAKENDRWRRHGLKGAISAPFGGNSRGNPGTSERRSF